VTEALSAMGFAANMVEEALENGCRNAEEAVAWCLEQPRESLQEEPPLEVAAQRQGANSTAGQGEGADATAPPTVVITSTMQDMALSDDEGDLNDGDVGESIVEVGDDLSSLNLDPPPHPSSSSSHPAAATDVSTTSSVATAPATTAAAPAAAPEVKATNAFASQLACHLGHPNAAIELTNRELDGLVHVSSVNEEALGCGVRNGDVLVGLAKRMFGAAPPPQASQVST